MTEPDHRADAITPAEALKLESQRLGALPIVDRFLGRMNVAALLDRHLPAGDARVTLPAANVIGVLVRNLCLEREPLYGLAEWADGFEPGLVGLAPGEAVLLNDDRVGRALEQLFDADRGSLLTELTLHAIGEFAVDCSQLHNDSTSIALHGDYTQADGRARGGKPTPALLLGHSKDHRPDLKQLVLILTVSADGAVPLAHRVADGNTSDDSTHIDTWDGLVALTGRTDFLYVADSKLCTREQMRHIDAPGGRFVTVLPRTRKEDGLLRAWAASEQPAWTEAHRRAGKRKGDPDSVWQVAPAPFPSSEGYRIAWVHSTQKQRIDETARTERIHRARRDLADLGRRLAGPRARISSRVAAEEAAAALLSATGAQRWVTVTVTETTEETVRQEKRGRPGKDTRYVKTTKTRYALNAQIDADQVRHDAASDGCFPLISNDQPLTDAELLHAYRYQPNLEKRHHQLKSVHDAAPIALHSPARIEALFACHFIALLCCCLIERELRAAMTRENVTELPLYHEDRSCTAPTAARVFDHFADVQRHHLTRHGEHIKTFQPQLTPLQHKLLSLLAMPPDAYPATTPSS
ncbi:MAG: IS1634 family transposase [Actinobacteria bacterium]|nr:IS1634 family transposase [Actinomycetota bacterium]MCA1698051.1 IS1634 family transposase [Actinomycetota bacterium]